jgi:hypothetical protein
VNNKLHIKPTKISPEVYISPSEGIIFVHGKSTMPDVQEFYNSILDFLNHNKNKFRSPLKIVFAIDVFNIPSSKRLLFIMYEMMDVHNVDVEFYWVYQKDDMFMKEVGEDYAYMIKKSFSFLPVDDLKKFSIKDFLKTSPSPLS